MTYRTSTRSVHQTPLSDTPKAMPSSAMPAASMTSTTGVILRFFHRRADCQAFSASGCMWTAWRAILLIYPLARMAAQASSVVP